MEIIHEQENNINILNTGKISPNVKKRKINIKEMRV